ncbi:MAG TPA: BadF/BadG/BcrA/BcrD ATPase family protein [Xanthobacteraceae bacterium]
MNADLLLLGIDGGGTRCRARLCTLSGEVLGEATTGPANLRLGLEQTFTAVLDATAQVLHQAGLPSSHVRRIAACLALAGASEPTNLAQARAHAHPFCKVMITTDAHAACLGAHGGRDGGVIVVGTGAIGWAIMKGRSYRVGGWGMPISDEGSGAWLGCEVLRRVLWALDGRLAWTPMLRTVSAGFADDPHTIVRWTQTASPRDFAALAPRIFDCARQGDPVADELLTLAAAHIDALARRLHEAGTTRLAVVGGCASSLRPWLSEETRSRLTDPVGDALSGAIGLARAAAQSLVRVA